MRDLRGNNHVLHFASENTDGKVNVSISWTSQPKRVSKRPLMISNKSAVRVSTSHAIVEHTERSSSTKSPSRTSTRLSAQYRIETNGPVDVREENTSKSLPGKDNNEKVEPLIEAENDVKSAERHQEKIQRLRTMWMKQHTGSSVVCKSAGPFLQWYHVVLISLATQIAVGLILCGLYFGLKRRRLFKHTDDVSENGTAAAKSEGNVSDKVEGNKT